MRVEGLAIPYSITSDNLLSLILLLCALLSVLIVVRTKSILTLRIRALFIHTTNLSNYRHTTGDKRDENFLIIMSIVSLGLMGYSVRLNYLTPENPTSHYGIMAAYTAIFCAYFFIKKMLYAITMPTYCSIQEWRVWKYLYHFIAALQGVWFLPITLVHIYLHLDIKITLFLIGLGVIIGLFTKIYNAWHIFFRKKKLYVPFFLYLCTLEAVPLALLAGVLMTITLGQKN